MSLVPGTRFGPYEVAALIGVGGMGEVYRARDTNLQREVALKVLPDTFAADPERLARFEREAQMLASLNHSNIAVIHGIEEGTLTRAANSGTVRALVLELVDGETIAERLMRGPVPLDEALAVARQIVDALAAAHERGVIHRDLKPANIKVRADGTVKVLDFGLAKALEGSLATTDASPGATLISPAMTRRGVILGTAAYMSPEQARGRPVDERSDIWAFGCVLFEMLAGKLVFGGEEVSDTMAAVLRAEPEWTSLPADTPPSVRRLLRHCLEKDPKRRLADIRDARLEIDDAAADPGGAQAPAAARPVWRERIAWAAAAVATVAAVAAAVLLRPAAVPVEAAVPSQLSILPPEDAAFAVDRPVLSISPDGRQVAFAATGADGTTRLWVRALDSLAPRVLPGTESARAAFWSSDSRFLAFFADGKLSRTDALGGPVQTLAEVDTTIALGGTWNEENVILFAAGLGKSIQRISASGGEPKNVIEPDTGSTLMAPFFLPDGRQFIYAVFRGPGVLDVYLASLDDATPTLLVEADAPAAYASGYLLYPRQGALMAHPFDEARSELTGDAIAISQSGVGANVEFSASSTGALVYRRGSTRNRLVWTDRDGKQTAVAAPASDYGIWELSRDDRRVAFHRASPGGTDVWTFDIQRQITSRLTTQPPLNNVPIWSPDGNAIAFATSRGGIGLDLYRRASTGAGDDDPLLEVGAPPILFPSDWSADGKMLTFFRTVEGSQLDTWVLPLEEGNQPFAFLDSRFNESQGQFSPDGKWFAYVSDQAGQRQVYVTSFPAPTGREQVSTAGGSQPRWRRDGRELFYLAPDGKLMAVAVQPGDTFAPDSPRALFDTPLQRDALRQTYAVSADGTRFLLQAPAAETTAPSLTVVLDWPALIKP